MAVVRLLAAHVKDLGFNSPVAQHIQRLISHAFTYGAVGSLVLSWSWTQQPGFHFLPVPLNSIV